MDEETELRQRIQRLIHETGCEVLDKIEKGGELEFRLVLEDFEFSVRVDPAKKSLFCERTWLISRQLHSALRSVFAAISRTAAGHSLYLQLGAVDEDYTIILGDRLYFSALGYYSLREEIGNLRACSNIVDLELAHILAEETPDGNQKLDGR